jgi:hypothetical protein
MQRLSILIATITLAMMTGCESQDSRLSDLAEQTTYQQAAQNEAMAELTQQVTEDHRRVVETVEESRRDVVALDREVREERNELDQERKAMSRVRFRESKLAPAIHSFGLLLVAALPLVICVHLLRGLSGQSDDEVAVDFLLRELTLSDSLLRLPGPSETLPERNEPEPPRLEGETKSPKSPARPSTKS